MRLVLRAKIVLAAADGKRNQEIAAVQADVLLSGHEPALGGYQLPNTRQIILDCCHDEARCAIVPTTGPVDQTRLVQTLVKL